MKKTVLLATLVAAAALAACGKKEEAAPAVPAAVTAKLRSPTPGELFWRSERVS